MASSERRPNNACALRARNLRDANQFGEIACAGATCFGDNNPSLGDYRWCVDLVDGLVGLSFQQPEQDARRQRPAVTFGDPPEVLNFDSVDCPAFSDRRNEPPELPAEWQERA